MEDLRRSGRPAMPATAVYIAKVKEIVTEKEIVIEPPPYSPDMTPADFFLFPKLKLPPRGTRFQSVEDIMENSRRTDLNSGKRALKCFDD
jgi:hypothetical protein